MAGSHRKCLVAPRLLRICAMLLPALLFVLVGQLRAEALLSSTQQNQPIHLTVGRTITLRTTSRLKRLYVSNPDVIRSFTPTPYEVFVTAKASGVTSLVIWVEDGPSTVYAISSDVDADGLREALASALPHDKIAVKVTQDRIELEGSVPSQAAVESALKIAAGYGKNIVNSLTIDPPHRQQVELKVRFLEVDRVKLAQFGLNLYRAGKSTGLVSTQQYSSFGSFAQNSATGSTNVEGASLTNPLNFFLYSSHLNIGVTLQDLAQRQVLQILAEPTITSTSGEEASFLSGGEFPFPVVQGGGQYTTITVQFRPYGVKLVFTPTVNPDGTIRLKVAPEVSALDYTNQLTVAGYTIPAISTRRAQTDVELKSGQSFAISGLLDHRLTDNLSKMPGIASVPILGHLFRSKGTNLSAIELVVIVTPTIVNPLSEDKPITEPKMVKPNLDQKQYDTEINKKNW